MLQGAGVACADDGAEAEIAVEIEEIEVEDRRELRFLQRGDAAGTLTLGAMRRSIPSSTVEVLDPYEQAEAAFDALPFAALLDLAYGPDWRRGEELLFTCSDGYQPTLPVRRVLEHRAWLAFDRREPTSPTAPDAAPGDFTIFKHESGERKRIELSPFYLVWQNLDDAQVRLDGDHGWPYQIVSIDLVRTRDRFPRMFPPADASAEVKSGFTAFRVHCSRCHRMNGDGGTIGPELNLPVSPLDHREVAWLRRWIDDPSQLQPDSRMPRLNPALPDRARTIDAILAYLRAMADTR
jgi:mono/diheme cytochrome c family protein